MSAARQPLSSEEPSPPATLEGTPSLPMGIPTVLLVASPDTRLLLKGLLRLQRHPVVFEADRWDAFEQCPAPSGTTLLVVDHDPRLGDWCSNVRSILTRYPDYRAILLTPDRSPELARQAPSVGVRAVVVRPFALREFAQALATATEGGAPPPPVAG
jgi:DNA-binding NarL/FixJ family response regulator